MTRRGAFAGAVALVALSMPLTPARASQNSSPADNNSAAVCSLSFDRPSFAASTNATAVARCLLSDAYSYFGTSVGQCAALTVMPRTSGAVFTRVTASILDPNCDAGIGLDGGLFHHWTGVFTVTGPALAYELDGDPERFSLALIDDTNTSHRAHMHRVDFTNPDSAMYPCYERGATSVTAYPYCATGSETVTVDSASTTAAINGVDERMTLGLALLVFLAAAFMVGGLGRGNA